MKNDAAPNPPKPKRPPGSFLVFMEDHFRNEYSLKNPNQPAGFASQAGAKQWKQMKDDEKAPFQRKAKELALEYFEKKRCYNNIESQEVNPLPEDVHMHSHEDPQAAPIAGAPPRRLRRRHIPVVPSSSPSPPLTVLVASMTSPSSSPQSCRAKTDAARSSDPNPQKPKRRPGSFLVFMEHFRKEFNLRNPGQPAWVSSQAGAEKWKQMKQDEKTPFQRKARELAVEYFQKKDCYNNPKSQGVNPLTPGSESVQMHKDKEGALPQGHDPLMSGSEGMQIHTDEEEDVQAQAAPPRPAAAMTCFWSLRPRHAASTSATMASTYGGASCEHVEDCSSVSLWSNLQHEEELSGPEASPESVKPRRQSLRDPVDGGGAAKLMINKRRRRMFG